MSLIKCSAKAGNAYVVLSNGGIVGAVFNRVSWRCIRDGKPSGRTFGKTFANEAQALDFYEKKVGA